jgi:hypothetical protein
MMSISEIRGNKPRGGGGSACGYYLVNTNTTSVRVCVMLHACRRVLGCIAMCVCVFVCVYMCVCLCVCVCRCVVTQ